MLESVRGRFVQIRQPSVCCQPFPQIETSLFSGWFQITEPHEIEASKAEKTGSKQKFPLTCSRRTLRNTSLCSLYHRCAPVKRESKKRTIPLPLLADARNPD